MSASPGAPGCQRVEPSACVGSSARRSDDFPLTATRTRAAHFRRRAIALCGDQRMRRSPSAGHRSSRREGLPPEVEELLIDVVADGFVLHCCGNRAAPRALVASYEWDHCIDLATIRDFDRVTVARVPKHNKVDVFAPEVVHWAYEGPPQLALRALLNLVHPAHPDAPTSEYPAPPMLCIPRAEQRPMTIRLPPPGRAGARATRLAAAMSTEGDSLAVGGLTCRPIELQTASTMKATGASPDEVI
jgi:hypothetical protein